MSILNNKDAEDSCNVESHNSSKDSLHSLVDSSSDVIEDTLTHVSHDHCYAINGCCVGSEYNRAAEQRSLLDTMITSDSSSSHDHLTKVTANDSIIKLIATATQEDQGYDTMSSSSSPVGAQDTTATPLSILEEKIKVKCQYTIVQDVII